MRDLLVITALLIIFLALWGIFFYCCHITVAEMTDRIENQLLPLVEGEDWPQSYQVLLDLHSDWEDFRIFLLLFANTDTVNEMDFTFSRASLYIKAEDVSNSIGELNAIMSQLEALRESEVPSLRSIL